MFNFVSSLGTAQLYSSEDRAEFRSIRVDSKNLAAALVLREKLTSQADAYALFSIGGRNKLQRCDLRRALPGWAAGF
jgi:hypothetical protein